MAPESRNKKIGRWVTVFVAALVIFYALDQVVMGAQGLPLTWSLAPRS